MSAIYGSGVGMGRGGERKIPYLVTLFGDTIGDSRDSVCKVFFKKRNG